MEFEEVLAELDIGPRSIVWDVGAGSGSVAVEAAAIAHGGKACAIEMDQEDYELIRANAEKFGRDNLVAVLGRAPEAWAELPDPDCVFVGGSGRDVSQIIELAYGRLKPGGRLVIPLGSELNGQYLTLIEKSLDGAIHKRRVLPVRFSVLQGGRRT